MKKKTTVNVAPGFFYSYAATETQIHDNRNVAVFFREKDLRPGTRMNLHFTRTSSNAAFLPRSVANSIPFSSKRLPDILSLFSVLSDSPEAEALEKTLRECEEPASAGETRYCATSLESMVDFSSASLGTRDVLAVSTEVSKKGTPKQAYTITPSGVQRLVGSKAVACHAQPFAYAVFYCHVTRATKAYLVSLAGQDGAKVDAVVVCHTDTSGWNPKHLAFQLLQVKPGTVPVCHFLPQDHIVWAPRR
ncbi:unnamed protein product [Spirodela intermedia]|uniref:BURP domain-containing protein n=1 Tax=Spirodela intermedia TaxID=51605 RepID=A0A7I8L0I7_SPIIN|nr:unnamed protein product [Spirodela intermedia]